MTPALLDTSKVIVGASGSGKTVTAKAEAEQLLGERRHMLVIDPTGVWYGLRSSADGRGPGFDVPIFGGPHGDVPILPDQGEAIARIVVEQRVSAIVDLSAMHTGRDWRVFARDLVAGLRRKPAGNFHLVVDEADEFAAERPADDVAFALREDLVWIAKRGRVKGFVPTWITQRTAEIAKAVISQAQTVIAHQLVAPQDRKAIDDYLKGNGTAEARVEVMGSLAELAVGERWVYSPRLKLLERGRTPALTTFDSSRTPAPGEAPAQPRMLAELDVSAIAALLAPPAPLPDDTIPADPAEAYAKGHVVGTMILERDRRIAELEAEVAGLQAEVEHLREVDAECDGYNAGLTAIEELVLKVRGGEWRTKAHHDAPKRTINETASAPVNKADVEGAPPAAGGIPPTPPPAGAPERQLGAERRPLALLAGIAPAGLTDAAWATLAGFKRTGGTWTTYRSRLRTAGLIEQFDGKWRATGVGVAAIGGEAADVPAPGPALVKFWAERVPGAGRMLLHLGKLYPKALKKEALAADLAMSAKGGTFGTYLSRLRGNGLLEEKAGRIRLAPALMGDEL